MSDNPQYKTIILLEALLENNNESIKGLSKAAELTDNITLKDYFLKKANRRSVYATEIVAAIREMGKTIMQAENSANVAGILHRAWMNISASFSESTKNALLRECKRGDESLLEDYRTLLKTAELSGSIRNVLQRQQDELVKSVEEFNELQWIKIGEE